jgi:hypothetical protein
MMILSRRIKHPLDVPVQGSHDADPRKHLRAAVAFGDQDQYFNGSLPFLDLLFCLVPSGKWLELVWRILRSHEGIVSGGKVNWLINGLCGKRLPTIDLAHVDLP